MKYRQLMLPGLEEAQGYAETLTALDGDGSYNHLEGGAKARHYEDRINQRVWDLIQDGNVRDTAPCWDEVRGKTLDGLVEPLTQGLGGQEPPRNGMAQAYMVLRDISYGLQVMRLPRGVERQMKPSERLAFYAGAGDLCARTQHYEHGEGPHMGFRIDGRHYEVKDIVDLPPEIQVSKIVSYGWKKNVQGFNRINGDHESMVDRVSDAHDSESVSDRIFSVFSGPRSLHDPNHGTQWRGGQPSINHIKRYKKYILDQAP